jgi:LemA protein
MNNINTKKIVIAVIVVLVVLIIAYIWGTYNGFVSTSEAVNNQWAQVETQYQRRLDLIPNVVEVAKKVMKQEQDIFGQIANARANYAGANTVESKVSAANAVESSFGRLLAIMENYPELKSADNMKDLTVELEGAENRISVERKRFNDMVQIYNLSVKKFPASFVAGMFNFTEEAYFESVSGAEVAPKVEF